MPKLREMYGEGYLRNKYHEGLANIVFTGYYIVNKLRDIFAREDLTYHQYNFLVILYRAKKPLTIKHIGLQMLDPESDISRICIRLIAKGLITKAPSKDRRLVDVSLTEAGQAFMNRVNLLNDSIDNIMRGLTNAEQKLLTDLLDKIKDAPVDDLWTKRK